MKEDIFSVTVIYGEKSICYVLGSFVDKKTVHSIKAEPVYLNPDPFMAYIGRDEDGSKLFQLSCEVPCVVEFVVS